MGVDGDVWWLLLQGRYFEAVCTKIDPVSKEITACFPTAQEDCFQLPYDMLIIGVGVPVSSLDPSC